MRGGGRGGGGGGVETRVEGQKEAPACLTHGVEGRAAWHGDGALLEQRDWLAATATNEMVITQKFYGAAKGYEFVWTARPKKRSPVHPMIESTSPQWRRAQPLP